MPTLSSTEGDLHNLPLAVPMPVMMDRIQHSRSVRDEAAGMSFTLTSTDRSRSFVVFSRSPQRPERRLRRAFRVDTYFMRDLVTLVCALGCGLAAGFFFAFSIWVMRALSKLAPVHGIGAMQSINLIVINPWFLAVFFGIGAACGLAVVWSLWQWRDPRAVYWLVGGALYLAGTILVTMLFERGTERSAHRVSTCSRWGIDC
jgi:uncharacterized membrane protein